jgi:hypothetical protein
MKYPFVFLFASIVLPVLVFVMLAGMVMTELGMLLDRRKGSGC